MWIGSHEELTIESPVRVAESKVGYESRSAHGITGLSLGYDVSTLLRGTASNADLLTQ